MRSDCKVCGAELSPDARYCHRCGARLAADQAEQGAGWQAALSWTALGAGVGAILTLLVLRGGSPAPVGAPSVTAAPDISTMSAEERATRLFNRVMRLHEEGKADSVQFFLPMALQSYAMLPAQDADTRYHTGLLELAGGNLRGARAQADSIQQLAATHLFAFMLRAAAGGRANDQAAVRQARADFRRHEQTERARQRPEYSDHASQLDAFLRDAVRLDAGR